MSVQGLNTLVCEQKSQLSKLLCDMQVRTNVEGPMTAQDHAHLFPPTLEEQALVSEFFFYNSCFVTRVKTGEAIEETGMTVQIEHDRLKEASGIESGSPYHSVLKAVASFSLMIVDGVTKIVAEQGLDDGGGILNEIPLVLPVDVCGMTPRDFAKARQNQKDRLLDKVSEEDIEEIGAPFRRLRNAYREEEGLKIRLEAVHSHSAVQSFKECWSPLGKDYNALKEYCGGLASVMPCTSLVEADFSLNNWTRDPHSKSLTDFSLGSILHCKQDRTLASLST